MISIFETANIFCYHAWMKAEHTNARAIRVIWCCCCCYFGFDLAIIWCKRELYNSEWLHNLRTEIMHDIKSSVNEPQLWRIFHVVRILLASSFILLLKWLWSGCKMRHTFLFVLLSVSVNIVSQRNPVTSICKEWFTTISIACADVCACGCATRIIYIEFNYNDWNVNWFAVVSKHRNRWFWSRCRAVYK